ncbi:MAG: MFS transporter [Firmicutes bacterium]|nr:MFS transporter [Bacillota bacterium]
MNKRYQITRLAGYSGSVLQAITTNVPPVLFIIFQEHFGITYAELGFLVLMTFVVQIVVDFVLARVSHKLNLRLLLQSCGVFSLVGYLMLVIAPVLFQGHVFAGLILACLFYSSSAGIIEVMSSPVNDAIPSQDKGSSMAFLHSFYCWGVLGSVLISTILLRLFGQDHWQWVMIFWMIIPITNFILYTVCPLPPMLSGNENGGVHLSRMPLFWVALLVMIASGASELAMGQWASMFAQKGLGVNKTIGDIAGPCFFAFLMGLGRLYYGIRGEKIRMDRALMLLSVLCVGSYLLTILSHSPILSLVGVGLCGLSVSMMWPGTLVLASKAIPEGGTKLFAMLALGGDIGCSLGPWLTGIISDRVLKIYPDGGFGYLPDQLALRIGLAAAIVFPILLFVCIPRLKKKEN